MDLKEVNIHETYELSVSKLYRLALRACDKLERTNIDIQSIDQYCRLLKQTMTSIAVDDIWND